MPAHGTAFANRRDIVPLCCWFLSDSRGTSLAPPRVLWLTTSALTCQTFPGEETATTRTSNFCFLILGFPLRLRDAGVYDRHQGGCNAEDALETPGVRASTYTSCTVRGESRAEGDQTKTACKTLLLVVSFLIRQKLP